MSQRTTDEDRRVCRKCGERLPTGKDLSMHNRIVHRPDALFIHNDGTVPREDTSE